MFRGEDTELEITYQILTFEPGESSGKRGNQLGWAGAERAGLLDATCRHLLHIFLLWFLKDARGAA